MRLLHLLLVTSVLWITARPAHSAPDPVPLRVRVHRLLMARHGLPEPEHFAALGPEGRQLLLELGADPLANGWQRGRALSALSHLPGPDVDLVYREVLSDPRAPLTLRRQLVILYARTFPATAPLVLAPLTTGSDLELRRVSQVNLQKLGAAARP